MAQRSHTAAGFTARSPKHSGTGYECFGRSLEAPKGLWLACTAGAFWSTEPPTSAKHSSGTWQALANVLASPAWVEGPRRTPLRSSLFVPQLSPKAHVVSRLPIVRRCSVNPSAALPSLLCSGLSRRSLLWCVPAPECNSALEGICRCRLASSPRHT